jgi:hypothetical protein
VLKDNFVSCTIKAKCSLADSIRAVAEKARHPIPIDQIPTVLCETILPRGQAVFGNPGDYFDRIAGNYDQLFWWITDKGLKMEVISSPEVPETFDEVAGRLMADARVRSKNGAYLKLDDYTLIARQLDEKGYKPLDHLQGKIRKVLSLWNQKHSLHPICTFKSAIVAEKPIGLRRATKRRLYLAEANFRKSHGSKLSD